jgi:hypothetical protein
VATRRGFCTRTNQLRQELDGAADRVDPPGHHEWHAPALGDLHCHLSRQRCGRIALHAGERGLDRIASDQRDALRLSELDPKPVGGDLAQSRIGCVVLELRDDGGDGGDGVVGPDPVGGHRGTVLPGTGPNHPIEHSAAHGQHDRDDDELDPAHPLPPLLAVVPGEDERDEEAEAGDDRDALAHHRRPAELVHHQARGLDHDPGPGQVGQRPLDQLALFQTVEERPHAKTLG